MILIYGKGKAGNGVASLCRFLGLSHEIKDDSDGTIDFSGYSEIIPSPGIPQTHAVYATGKVTSELDFGYRYLPKNAKIAAVTGTDGKSTTCWILYRIFADEFGEENTFLSGNFDIPFCETVRQIREKNVRFPKIILEVSSFMAYAIKKFQADWSIFTNFAEDHLNWHPNLEEYFRAKWRIFEHTKTLCCTTEKVLSEAEKYSISFTKMPLRIFGVSSEKNYKDRVQYPDIFVSGHKKYCMTHFPLSGVHNALNILGCSLVAGSAKICSKRVNTSLKNIHGLPHRIEKIGTLSGRDCIDDSKSTTPQSLGAALGAFTEPVSLIVGGSDKGADFSALVPIFTQKVAFATCIGATGKILQKELKKANVPSRLIPETDGKKAMQEAVEACISQGTGTILLSPGCASFGLFKDYLDRAHTFQEVLKSQKRFQKVENNH